MADAGAAPVLVLEPRPATRRAWLREVASFWPVLRMLAAKEFKTRYRGTTFGVVWAVVVPLLQATVLAVVFSRIARFEVEGGSYAAYVLTGMLLWSYFATSLPAATTAVVDGSNLADKVWFPRVLLILTVPLSNLIGLAVTHVILLGALPILGADLTLRLLALPLVALLLVVLTIGLGSVLGAMHVYFRDTKYLLQAALLVWIYLTPIIYPADLLGRWAGLLDANPLTGVVGLARWAALGGALPTRSAAVAIAAAVALLVVAAEVHRRHDRRFVDLL